MQCYHIAQFELNGVLQSELSIKLQISSFFNKAKFYAYLPEIIQSKQAFHQNINQYILAKKPPCFDSIYPVHSHKEIPKTPKHPLIIDVIKEAEHKKHHPKLVKLDSGELDTEQSKKGEMEIKNSNKSKNWNKQKSPKKAEEIKHSSNSPTRKKFNYEEF